MGDRNGRLRDERNWFALPQEIKEANRITSLQNATDFLDALAALSPYAEDREIYLRRRLWWISNDHHRFRVDGTPTESQPVLTPTEARNNILRLLALLENDFSKQVERGELLRQLGRFDEAIAVLKAVKPDGYSEVKASKIQRLAQACHSKLASL